MLQTGINPPTFKIKIGEKDVIKKPYLKYLEKELRKNFGFEGTPVSIRTTYNS
jgi:GTP-binding protein